ncbi:MAG: right-handed parallel beta-helix repeat-containing protein [Myxococcota bacterium]
MSLRPRGGLPGGDGVDWSTAWTALPDALQAGHVYLLAAGDYPGRTFADAAAEDALVTVVRATAADHGTDAGWDASYDGTVGFGPRAARPWLVLDGRGREVVVHGAFQGTAVTVRADDVVLRSLDIDGAFVETGGQHTDGACTGLDVVGEGVVVEDCVVHDAADDGVVVSGSSGLLFSGNEVHALHGCGTDGGCGPCYNGHSDGLELFDVKSSTFRGNLVYDVRSTATVFFGNWGGPDEYNEDLVFEDNLLYAPEVGLVVYLHYARGIRFVHNVVWGVRQGGYGGLSLGPELTDLDLSDNVILSVNFDHTGGSFDPATHHGDHNLFGVALGQWPAGPDDLVVADPAFEGIPDVDGAPVASPGVRLHTGRGQPARGCRRRPRPARGLLRHAAGRRDARHRRHRAVRRAHGAQRSASSGYSTSGSSSVMRRPPSSAGSAASAPSYRLARPSRSPSSRRSASSQRASCARRSGRARNASSSARVTAIGASDATVTIPSYQDSR